MRCAWLTAVVVSDIAIGCGGDGGSDDRTEVERVAKAYVAALDGSDPDAACARMTAEAQTQAGETVTAAFPEAGDLPCPEAMRDLTADLEPAVRWALRKPDIVAYEASDGRGSVRVKRLPEPVELRQEDGDWKLARGIGG